MRAKVFRSLIRMLVHLVLLGQWQAAIARRLAASRWPATATRRPRPAPAPTTVSAAPGGSRSNNNPVAGPHDDDDVRCVCVHPIPSHPDDARVFLLDCSASDDGSAHTNLKSIT